MTRPVVTYDELRQLVDGYEGLADEHGLLVRADIADLQINVRVVDATPMRGQIMVETALQVQSQDESVVPLVGGRAHHPGLGVCRTADLLVVAEDILDRQPDDFAVLGPSAAAAVEVSADGESDALRTYRRLGVPVYAHVDPRCGTLTVHSASSRRTYKFGDAVQLGPWTIDTSKFPAR
ncbi:Uma2 family endonuclease [Streptomyces luteolus]|uniref:Uma2 family endonuclease n=1 Tax=Streptomyces luteolus TaxID=3043615 RepID=A0ABT6SR64_9ACTN|nr:Uma2 family endonuclease [Streptomyces sp. B-S-A12]MDI3418102.1 Uma2 family endonuclease [Streptomyces sp. B-S-A12]